MITELVRDAVPGTSALLLVIGFHPEEQPDVLRLAPASGEVVDLDTIDPGTPVDGPASGEVALIARTSTDLRRALSLRRLLPRARRHVIAVAMTPPERRDVPAMTFPDPPDMRAFQARRGPEGGWSVDAEFVDPVSLGESLAALMRGLGRDRLRTMPGPRVALAGVGAAHWRPGDPAVALTTMSGPLSRPNEHLPADIVLRSTGQRPVEWSDPRLDRVVDRPRISTWQRAGSGAGRGDAATAAPSRDLEIVPPVDERSVNPSGFVTGPSLGDAVLAATAGGWSIEVEPGSVVRFHPTGAVTDVEVARLRQLRTVTIEWGPVGQAGPAASSRAGGSPDAVSHGTGPVETVRLVAGLAAAGVPLVASDVPQWAMASLGGELADLIKGMDARELADDLRREEHSIRIRRAALRAHSTEARWRGLALTAGLPVPPPPTVSVVLCTRRPEFLGFALGQIAAQRGVDLELILTLHGIPADLPEVKAAVAGFDKPITVLEVPSDSMFGAALNQGVSRASGRFVAKWDDDDWYSPDFLADMVLASSYSGAELIGCHAQFIYLGQIDLTIFRKARSEVLDHWVSGGTFVLEKSVLDAVGGFPAVPFHVDAALRDALMAAGARIYRTHNLGYVLHRRAAGHTWNQPLTYFLRVATSQWRGPRFSAFINPADSPLPRTDTDSVPG